MQAPFKVIILGIERCGKTSILQRLVYNSFNQFEKSSVIVTFLSKTIQVDNKRVSINVWDTAGQERYSHLSSVYYRDADYALLVYDTTDEQSLERVDMWVQELRRNTNNVPMCIVGNKSDLERRVSGESYAVNNNVKHYFTSAKTGDNVLGVFTDIARELSSQPPKLDDPAQIIDDDEEDSDTGCGC
ncbi:hypothetical protein PCE1_001782 [Barthelona sp. PCE]